MEIQLRHYIFIRNKRQKILLKSKCFFFVVVQIQFILKLDDDRDGEEK